ncbi:MAG: hypothetical protein Q7R95_07165 [bacterium]|nr:hypothetical protein [bacterium]
MSKTNIIGQKIKGNIQQIKGKVEYKSGQHVKGTVDTIRGKANVIGSDIRNKVENS